jgi:hypothetical protein
VKHFKSVAAAVGLLLVQGIQAQQVVVSDDVSVGVQALGTLGGGGVGITLAGHGDGITPGCLCEGWGASFGAIAGWSANAIGNFNVSGVSFSGTSASATSVVNVGTVLQVTQVYGPSFSSSLIRNHVTLLNISGSAAEVRYSRSMDWDIPPSIFNELVTISGVGASRLIYSSDNGFGVPNPLINPGAVLTGTENTNFSDSGPADHGAFFTFSFGVLGAGESVSFDIFYGATRTEAAAFAALGTVGAEVYSLGQSNGGGATGEPATYVFGFAGVGGTSIAPVAPIPEPGTYALMFAGLGVIGWQARRRKDPA